MTLEEKLASYKTGSIKLFRENLYLEEQVETLRVDNKNLRNQIMALKNIISNLKDIINDNINSSQQIVSLLKDIRL